MTGSASSVIITTDAPMMPVVAAMMVPMSVTESASPPGTRRVNTCRQFKRSFATPDFSSIVPMNMNMGMATSTGFSMVWPKIRLGRTLIRAQFNTPARSPMTAKASPMPPSVKATGNPVKSKSPRAKNMKTGRSSTRLIKFPRQSVIGPFVVTSFGRSA